MASLARATTDGRASVSSNPTPRIAVVRGWAKAGSGKDRAMLQKKLQSTMRMSPIVASGSGGNGPRESLRRRGFGEAFDLDEQLWPAERDPSVFDSRRVRKMDADELTD